MEVTLISITPNAEHVIASMGRIARRSESPNTDRIVTDAAFIKKLIGWGHESVLEHASATIELSGVSRALSHQLVRHRLVSYTQESQRYVHQDQFEYVMPPSIANDQCLRVVFDEAMKDIQALYERLITIGHIVPEDARFVLPNACCTRIGITANFRQWRHMIALRCDAHAQWEIREAFRAILVALNSHAPAVFSDLYGKFITERIA
jgi:thymidylate synthase (FAD)